MVLNLGVLPVCGIEVEWALTGDGQVPDPDAAARVFQCLVDRSADAAVVGGRGRLWFRNGSCAYLDRMQLLAGGFRTNLELCTAETGLIREVICQVRQQEALLLPAAAGCGLGLSRCTILPYGHGLGFHLNVGWPSTTPPSAIQEQAMASLVALVPQLMGPGGIDQETWRPCLAPCLLRRAARFQGILPGGLIRLHHEPDDQHRWHLPCDTAPSDLGLFVTLGLLQRATAFIAAIDDAAAGRELTGVLLADPIAAVKTTASTWPPPPLQLAAGGTVTATELLRRWRRLHRERFLGAHAEDALWHDCICDLLARLTGAAGPAGDPDRLATRLCWAALVPRLAEALAGPVRHARSRGIGVLLDFHRVGGAWDEIRPWREDQVPGIDASAIARAAIEPVRGGRRARLRGRLVASCLRRRHGGRGAAIMIVDWNHYRVGDREYVIGRPDCNHARLDTRRMEPIVEELLDLIASSPAAGAGSTDDLRCRWELLRMILPTRPSPSRSERSLSRLWDIAFRHDLAWLAPEVTRLLADIHVHRHGPCSFPVAIARNDQAIACQLAGGDRQPAIRFYRDALGILGHLTGGFPAIEEAVIRLNLCLCLYEHATRADESADPALREGDALLAEALTRVPRRDPRFKKVYRCLAQRALARGELKRAQRAWKVYRRWMIGRHDPIPFDLRLVHPLGTDDHRLVQSIGHAGPAP
jgi:hypothetical protein